MARGVVPESHNTGRDLLQKFRATQQERRLTLDGVRKALIAGREPQNIEFDESIVTALRAQKDLTEGADTQ